MAPVLVHLDGAVGCSRPTQVSQLPRAADVAAALLRAPLAKPTLRVQALCAEPWNRIGEGGRWLAAERGKPQYHLGAELSSSAPSALVPNWTPTPPILLTPARQTTSHRGT